MSTRTTKRKHPKAKKDSIFDKKRAYNRDADSWDFDAQQMTRQDSNRKLTIGDKVENAIHNVGEITEEKVSVITSKNNKNENIKNLSKMKAGDAVAIVDTLIPAKFIRWILRFVVGLYGFIGFICVALLVVYCADYFIATFYRSYSKHDYIFLWIIIVLCTKGAIIGLYGTFKYGAVDEQMDILRDQNESLRHRIKNVTDDSDKLQESIDAFQLQVDGIMDNESDLRAQVKAFQKLENALKAESKSQNAEIVKFLNEVRDLFGEFKLLQIQVEKTNLLNLFYELEFRDDDVEGLNETEYDMFLSRLDKSTAAKFKKTFADMDENGDGTIDLNEFQSAINLIYKRIEVGNKYSKGKGKKRQKGKWNKFLK